MIFDKMENISDYFEELPLLKKVAEFAEDFEKNGKEEDRKSTRLNSSHMA